MNSILSMPHGLGAINVGEMLALPSFATEKAKTARSLPAAADELVDNVSATITELVLYAIEQRSAGAFTEARAKVFPKYFDTVLGLSFLLPVLVPEHVLEVRANESFSEIENEFRENGRVAFGSEVRDQAIFTAWTLRKIGDLCRQINKVPISDGIKNANSDLFREFIYHGMCTRFSLDCLIKSMTLQKPIYPEILPILVDGLRSAVNTYALARRALDLRVPRVEPEAAPVEWDDEEQALLREAAHDILPELA